MSSCEICPYVEASPHEFTVAEGEHWVANLRENDQSLLGTTFVTLKRHEYELDRLTAEEDAEFIVIRNGLIRALRASFQPVTFNISCLKNDAFKHHPDTTPPEDAHVHWHFKPRYSSKPIVVNGEEFTDPMPGRYLTTFERTVPARATALLIAETIRTNLEQ